LNESFENRKCNLTQYELRKNTAGPNTKKIAELQFPKVGESCMIKENKIR